MIPQSFIQDLLNRLDIVDVVERYLPLKKAGSNYVACCPFHGEKTPSFTVSPAKQFYHCFGCGAHGTAISFVMEHQGMSFVEAVHELAKSLGLPVPEEKAESGAARTAPRQNDDLPEIMSTAARYYRSELKQSDTAISYLKNRGLSGEIAARFGIGYAPQGWQNLQTVFPDYQAEALAQAGLVINSEEGRRYDRFRDRIMFPILNQRGIVIGFGGRVLGAGEPKYLNSPETPLFEKGRELYGLFQARQAIRAAGRVLVVEGYMDVVALAQHGVEYAVATLGTATTPVHVQKLLRQSEQIVFCFDGDSAGRRAAWRALENSLALLRDGANLSFLFLPQGEDPDSYVRKIGKEGFEALLAEALPLSQFLLRELTAQVDMQSQEGRARFLQLVKPLLQQIAAPALGLMLRKRAAELAGISQAELESLFQIKQAARRAPSRQSRPRKLQSVPRKLLQLLLFRPALAASITGGLPQAEDAEMQTLASLLEFVRDHPHIESASALIEHFRGAREETLLQEVWAETPEWDEAFDVDQEFAGGVDQLRKNGREKRVNELLSLDRTQRLSGEEKAELAQLLQRAPQEKVNN